MKRQHIHIVLVIFVLTLSSCATMFNSKKGNLTIITSEPTFLVLEKDTLKGLELEKFISYDRDNKPINIRVFNDSLSKTIQIKQKNSFTYWLNLYPNIHLWSGFYIDTKTKKRYTYPKTVYIDLKDSSFNYKTYIPSKELFSKSLNIIKFTPLKIIGFSNPSLEFSFEKTTGKYFSSQFIVSYLLPHTIMDIGQDFKPNIKGFNVAFEEKYYFHKSAPTGPYISFEFDFLKTQYHDIWNFGVKNTYTYPTYTYTNYPDTFGINKKTYSFNIKYGYQYMHKRIIIDFYVGLGLRYKDVEHFDRIKPNDEMEMPEEPSFYYITNLNGKYWTLSIPFNI